MGTPSRLLATALLACSTGLGSGVAAAQSLGLQPSSSISESAPVTQIASATTGTISGSVLDDRGQPLDGVVVSAIGGSTSFAVTDRDGRYTLNKLMPGPYLVRAHLEGYLPARSSMVTVRPSSLTLSTFTMRRAGPASDPRVARAGLGVTDTDPATPGGSRDDSEVAWRLRHLKRSILRDTTAFADIPAEEEEWFLTDSIELLGRAVGSSARVLFADSPLNGQVNLLTTGAFDTPGQLLQLERTRGVTFVALGAPVGVHGDWTVKAALNQGDLSSWILAADYVTRDPARHRYQFGMSYGLHRYEGGNAAAIAAIPETSRNVGAVYGYDEWKLSRYLTLGYGAHYGHYDYLLDDAEHFSPRVSATIAPTAGTRIRAVATRRVIVPGAEEFLPPTRAHVLPPQRTFAPLGRDGFKPEDFRHYEVAVERSLDGATIGVRAFQQSVSDQLVTIFGMRSGEAPLTDIGHYVVASAGDVDLRGFGVVFTHALASNVRGSVEYALADATWFGDRSPDRTRLLRWMPSALRSEVERVHDITTTLETELPQSATRVYFLYKMNSAYIRADGTESRPGLDGRWDVQVSQGLPFMNFLSAEWEMLVAVRNLFRESFTETSIYDELLVARPPKRLVGGLTVKF